MKVTPLELRQRQFATVMRGYDRAEVNTILALAADDYEAALHEIERLKQELGKSESAVNEHRTQEKQLSNTLLSAQKLADDIKDRAQQDAARIVADAEARAVMMVDKSKTQLADVLREIETLRAKRREVEASLEGIVDTLNKTIKTVREQDSLQQPKALMHTPAPASTLPAPVLASARPTKFSA
jgi:cell division initiation protein